MADRPRGRATSDPLGRGHIAANSHPGHCNLATFRRQFAQESDAVFVQVLQVAGENRLSRFGTVSLDGPRIHTNASRHRGLSHGHAEASEAQLRCEVQALLGLAEEADGAERPDGLSLPEELKRPADRLAAIARAKARIEARVAERFEREQAEHDAKRAARARRATATGRRPRGQPPKAPTAGPFPEDHI